MLAPLCLLLTFQLQAQVDTSKSAVPLGTLEINLIEQEETPPLRGKKGQLILPQKGDFNLGVNIIPFFNWFGNSFNGSQNNTYASSSRFFEVFGTTVIMGRYMLQDNAALRLNFGINVTSVTNSRFVTFDNSTNPSATVKDTRTTGGGTYAIGMGYEKRRGKGRIQGYYGIDVLFQLEHIDGASYTYGNEFSASNSFPSSTDWGGNILPGGERIVQDGARMNASVGVRPFVGLEYFVAPKLSIGGEFGWGLSYSTIAPRTRTVEFFDGNEAQTRTDRTGGGGRFNAGLDNLGGAILLNFYF